jgi:FemAB-related protein (PEP-CTERM system-associated)
MIASQHLSNIVEVMSADRRIELPDRISQAVGFVGTDAWMDFVTKVYGFRSYHIVATSGDRISGYLALSYVRHPLLGNYLVTAPFASYGGLAASTTEAREALLTEARELRNRLGAHFINVRFEDGELQPPASWVQQPSYATYQIDLQVEPEELLKAYSSDHRNHIRKALKKGFSIRFGRTEIIDDVYETLARSMHELGSPYHAKSYLHAMAEALGEKLEFALVRSGEGRLAGAGAFIRHGDTVANLHANILRRFRQDYAGEFLYWSAIQHYAEIGLRVFDLGRSLIGSGNDAFKSKWRPRKQLLAYWYAMKQGEALPEMNQKSRKFQMAIWTWKRLPSFVVRPAGPFLIKGFA